MTNTLTFTEYWFSLKSQDFKRYTKLKLELADLMKKTESAIRKNIYNKNFTQCEKIVISAFVSEYENNENITIETLFPNPEKQAS